MSKYAHKGQILPITNQMIPIDKETTFHASYDYDLNGFNQGELVNPLGATTVASFTGGAYIPTGTMSSMGLSYNNFTVEFWYRKRSGYLRILGTGPFCITDGGDGVFKVTKYGIVDIFIGTIPNDTNWHHLALSYSSTTGVSLYLDGLLHGTHTNTANLSSSYPDFPRLGLSEYGIFEGEVSEFRIWNKVLSLSEVKRNMNRFLTGEEVGLVKYFKLNEKEGSIIFDSSTLANSSIKGGAITPTYGPTVATLKKEEGKFRGAALIEPDTVNRINPKASPTIPGEISTDWSLTKIDDYTWKITALKENPGVSTYGNIVSFPTSYNAAINETVTYSGRVVSTNNSEIKIASTGWGPIGDGPGHHKYSDRIARQITHNVVWSHGFCIRAYNTHLIKAGDFLTFSELQLESRAGGTSFVNGARTVGKLWYPKELINPSAFTISCWFKIPYMHRISTNNTGIVGSWYHPIIEIATATSTSQAFGIVAGPEPASWNRRLILQVPLGITAEFAVQDNTWYHMTTTFNGTAYKVYIDGVEQISGGGPPISVVDGQYLMVGGGYQGKPNIMIDELRIESRAISLEEVEAWAASGLHYNYLDYSQYVD